MAFLWMDSFNHYVFADMFEKWTSQYTTFGTNSMGAFGRHSSNAYRAIQSNTGANSYAAYIQKTILPSGAGFVIGIAMKMAAAPSGSSGVFVAVFDGGTVQLSLRVNLDLTISVLRGGTVIATSTTLLTTAVANFIEFRGLIDPAAGNVNVRVNGVATGWPSFTGNTRNSGTSQWNSIGIGSNPGQTQQPGVGTYDFNDLYVLDRSGAAPWNDFLGDVRADSRYETAAGATTGFTPSAGSNFQNVDEVAPNDDTDYNSAAAVATDTFVFQDAPVPGAAIFGVQHNLSMRKTDAGLATVAPVVRHSGVDNVGADIAVASGYTYGTQIQQVNPGTGLQWTEADFNAAEFGYKRTL